MAVGLPVIATEVGGNVEQVQDGVTGFLVPPGDSEALAKSIAALVRDPGTRKQFGDNAYQCCRTHYNIDAMISRLQQHYWYLAGKEKDGAR